MSFLKVLRKAKLREREARVLLLGLDNAGKTTVMHRLMQEPVSTVSPTLGFEIRTLTRVPPPPSSASVSPATDAAPESVGQPIAINVWDVGGQTSLRSYWRNYFESTDAVVWVVDAADGARMTDSEAELSKPYHHLLSGQQYGHVFFVCEQQ